MFRPPIIQLNKKQSSSHPLKQVLKCNFQHKINYIHNSINNPEYPKAKLKFVNQERCKFAVIGNRVTREFLECTHIVNALYKYRQDAFDAPVIKALTALEWSMVMKDLKVRHGEKIYCIHDCVAVIVNGQYLGGEQELKEYLETKFRYHVPIDHYTKGIEQFAKFIDNYNRTCVYMHLTIEEDYIGTFIFMLYDDIVPVTCANFVRMCEKKRGGYSGTAVHRIVKDGWIQCGGYGLKNDDIECENYIVPHDRRGVLCMANDGRHINNSTQFFVLLQPAEWMAFKYVAFGQLIDGDETLTKIENLPTWYEEPMRKVYIRRSGVLNMIAHDIPDKIEGYIEGHIEDLNALGRYLIDLLMVTVWLEIEFRAIAKMSHEKEIHEDAVGTAQTGYGKCRHGPTCQCVLNRLNRQDLDEDNHYLENEDSESSVDYTSNVICDLVESLPKRPYYIGFTDVEDPNDVDSNFDLKRLLQGYYCLESDVPSHRTRKLPKPLSEKIILNKKDESKSGALTNTVSNGSLDTEENEAVKQYFRKELDYMSFGGNVIRGVAKSFRQELVSTTPKRSSVDCHQQVSTLPSKGSLDSRRAPTKKKGVRIASDYINDSTSSIHLARRPTGFVHNVHISSSDDLSPAESAPTLQTKFNDNNKYGEGPKLKDYVPFSETTQTTFLTRSAWRHMQNEGSKEKFPRRSVTVDSTSFLQLHKLNLQHGKRLTRKISSDYVKTMDTGNVEEGKSIRSVLYARRRPSLTISEYRTKIALEKEEALQRIMEKTEKLNALPANSDMICHKAQKEITDIDEKPSLPTTPYWQMSEVNSIVESEEPHDSSLGLRN